jgi:phosphatidylglycerol:prolipoprotein diacylglycerol transferase
MGLIAYLLWQLRDRFQAGVLFSIYLVLAGAERFLVEFIRRNDDVLLGLTQAQLISLAMIAGGAAWLFAKSRQGSLRRAPVPAGEPAIR